MGSVMGQHNVDGIHLIGQNLIQNFQIEHIALFHKIQVREHLLICHAGMGCQNRVSAFTTHRKGCAKQMPYADLQGICIGAMVDGQGHGNIGNLHIAHDAVSGEVQKGSVVFRSAGKCFIAESIFCLHSGY